MQRNGNHFIFLAGHFESLSFLSLLDGGYEKKPGPFLLHTYLKDVILKDQSVLLSVWFHAHV